MDKNDTIIVVGVTELDGYNNLWVTPQGGGDKIKIGAKREHLHPIFEQGKAVLLHWETYKGKTYVADAKPVEGELPPARESQMPAPHKDEPVIKPSYKLQQQYRGRDEDKVDMRTFVMEVGEDFRAGKRDKSDPLWIAREAHLMSMGQVTEVKNTTTAVKSTDKIISVGDIKEVAYNQCGWTKDDLGKYCQKKYKVGALSELLQSDKVELIDYIKANPKK